jgi:hypothetical protein
MYTHTRKIIMLLLFAFAIEFVVLLASNLSSIRLGKRKPPPPDTSRPLVDVITF